MDDKWRERWRAGEQRDARERRERTPIEERGGAAPGRYRVAPEARRPREDEQSGMQRPSERARYQMQRYGGRRSDSTARYGGVPPRGPAHPEHEPRARRDSRSGWLGSQPGAAGLGPRSDQRSDERIREDLAERLMFRHHLDCTDVSVEVKSGVVSLEGSVPERWMKHEIEDLADGTRGVQDIENRIRVH